MVAQPIVPEGSPQFFLGERVRYENSFWKNTPFVFEGLTKKGKATISTDEFGGRTLEVPLGEVTTLSSGPKLYTSPKRVHKLRHEISPHDRVFGYLVKEHKSTGQGLSADAAVELMEIEDADGKPKTDTVKPIMTGFKKAGIVVWRGLSTSRLGSSNHINCLTENAAQLFQSAFGRYPIGAQ